MKCQRIQIKCRKCSTAAKRNKFKPLFRFALDRVLQCKAQRTLSSRAVCLACEKDEDWEPRQRPQGSTYECSVCRKDLPLRHFHGPKIRKLEADGVLYRATCCACEASQEEKRSSSKIRFRCQACEKQLPRHAFSPARYHHKDKSDWACLECEYPTCSGSGCDAKPDRPHIGEYMCAKCLYPPCVGCGKPRPRRSNGKSMSVHVQATWTCADCRPK